MWYDDDYRLVVLNDFNKWIRREYSKRAFVRYIGDQTVLVLVPLASQEKIDLLATDASNRVSITVQVKFSSGVFAYLWHTVRRWWEGV